MWDDDLNFDGLALQYEDPVAATRTWRPFGTVGLFPLEDIQTSESNDAKSKWLIAAQGGVEWVPSNDLRAKVGLGLYDFRNISGVRNSNGSNTTDDTSPLSRQKGNTLFNITNPTNLNGPFGLANDYQVLNLTGAVDFNLYNPVHLIVTGDYLKNIGFSSGKTLARSGLTVPKEDTGYMLRVAVGMPAMLLKNDWQLSLAYRYLEADATVDAFAVDLPIYHWACQGERSPWRGRLEILPGNLSPNLWYYSAAVANQPGNADLLAAIDEFIAHYRAQPAYRELVQRDVLVRAGEKLA